MARSKLKEAADRAEVHRRYSDWLKEEGKEDSKSSKAIFAFRITSFGKHKFCGFSEKGINVLLGGDPYYMD